MRRSSVPLIAIVLLSTGCLAPPVAPTTLELDLDPPAPLEAKRLEVDLGTEVTLTGTSEVDDVLHIHGYEHEIDVVAGEIYEYVFEANMSGVYEIETHDPAVVWARLVVS